MTEKNTNIELLAEQAGKALNALLLETPESVAIDVQNKVFAYMDALKAGIIELENKDKSHAAELERVREEEFILCAAIWYKDLETQNCLPVNCESGVVLSGWRHSNVIAISNALTGKRMAEVGDYVQGFLTNKNRFVGRQEGWTIAEKAKQINNRERGSNGTLYSEDLY